jgi:spore coat protein U-like protein
MRFIPVRKILFAAACVVAALPSASYAGSSSANLAVSSTVITLCTISTTPVAFGNYSGSAIQSNGSVIVTCTVGSAYTVDLGQGSNYSSGRRMNFTTNYLSYDLYKDSGDTQIWGSTSGGSTASGTGTGLAQTLTVYGLLPASQNEPAGAYIDTVSATVSF